jgi:hypothetical protein
MVQQHQVRSQVQGPEQVLHRLLLVQVQRLEVFLQVLDTPLERLESNFVGMIPASFLSYPRNRKWNWQRGIEQIERRKEIILTNAPAVKSKEATGKRPEWLLQKPLLSWLQ